MKVRSAHVVFAIMLAALLLFAGTAVSQQKTDTGAAQGQDAGKAKPDSTSVANTGEDDRAAQTKGAIQRPTGKRPDLVLDQSVVSVVISVTDPLGRFVTGLGTDHFEVFDDKIKQEITFFSDEDSPISVGIVYDVSGSMKERITRSVRALRRFIETSHNDDDFFLIGFNDRAKLIQDFTTSGDQIAGHLMMVQPKGSTALYDAAYLAIEKVQQGRHTKKALLIISDGQDNHSRYTYKELRNRAKEADVAVYAIGITDPADSLNGFGRSILEELTRMTGGRSFFPNAYNEPELVEICTRIALELRKQYSIGFYPTDLTSEAKWHKVQVKVKPPKGLGRLSLSYRDGYQSFKK